MLFDANLVCSRHFLTTRFQLASEVDRFLRPLNVLVGGQAPSTGGGRRLQPEWRLRRMAKAFVAANWDVGSQSVSVWEWKLAADVNVSLKSLDGKSSGGVDGRVDGGVDRLVTSSQSAGESELKSTLSGLGRTEEGWRVVFVCCFHI